MLLHYEDKGTGPLIVLLHGMAASVRDWDLIVPQLVNKHRVISIDLLGFGHSPMPKDVTYNVSTHLKSITDTLNALKIDQPFTLVGHSMGALLALKFAITNPGSVSKLVLIAMPIYKSADEARKTITSGRLSRRLAYYGPTSHALCATWCKFLRPISSRLAHLYLKDQPPAVARESVLHTWQSYNQSMRYVIEEQQVEQDLSHLNIPTKLIYGNQERATILQNYNLLKELPVGVTGEVINGRHNLPVECPDVIATSIMAE